MEIQEFYKKNKLDIQSRLRDFKNIEEKSYINELIFCILTPQSKAEKCWSAVLEINKLKKISEKSLVEILKTRTRFHNNKSKYVLEGISKWEKIKEKLNHDSSFELRNWLAENVKGIGLKESSHFLRNIGKSNNEIAILDRHILKNLHENKIISEAKVKSKNNYLEIEKKYLDFANEIGIAPDELDLLFWKKEHGVIFK
jgi:N-glycosylase/DNA lyase